MRKRLGRLALFGFVLVAGAATAEAGNRNGACGGALQRHCCAIPPETSNLLPCDAGLVTHIGGPGAGTGPAVFPFGPACSAGTCYSTNFPSACGGRGEVACTLDEHFLQCQGDLRNKDGVCRHTDDLFPGTCGHENQAPCNVIVQVAHGIPSCQSSLREVPFPFPAATCIRVDAEGFPSFCGHLEQDACTLDVQLWFGIRSCSGLLTEVGFPDGQCLDTRPADCGDNGQRPCTVFEHFAGPCKAGLSIRNQDFGECGADPVTWPADEVPRGGPRTVFLIHGRGGDWSLLEQERDSLALFHQLKFKVPSVRAVSGLDWNAGASPARKVMVRELVGDPANDPLCDRVLHTCDLPAATDTNGDGLVDEQDADPVAVCSGGPRAGQTCRSHGSCRLACYAGAEPGRPEAGRSCSVTPCNSALEDKGEFGEVTFDLKNFRIWEVARGMSEAIKAVDSTADITIVAHSFGGVIARHLVYRHYDELRLAGKRIAEVITLAAPHQGGQAATPDIPQGAALQNHWACLGSVFEPAVGHLGCEIGGWIDWVQGKPAGRRIDDQDFPQIRWIVAAAGGRTLDLQANIDPVRAIPFSGDFISLMESLQDPRQNFHDSDGTITVRSAFGIQPDECYPFTRDPAPAGGPGAQIVKTTARYNELHYDENGDGVFTEADQPIATCAALPEEQPVVRLLDAASAACHHPGARVDARVTERSELTCLNHVDFGKNRDLNAFVIAALSLAGDTNGDGVVNAHDHPVTAHAGPDQTLECAGPLTDVGLDASGSSHVLGQPLTYAWSGGFGAASGVAPTVSLGVGSHALTLSAGDGAGGTDTDGLTVTVQDTVPPALEGASAWFLEATAVAGTPFAFVPMGSDLCGAVTFAVSPQLDVYPLGTTDLAVTASDPSGNSAAAVVQVSVADTTPPVVVAPPGLTSEANAVLSAVAIGTASATDIFPVTVANDAPAGFPLGNTVVTWTATDANGNAAGAAQTVTVVDTTPPALVAPADVTVTALGALTPAEVGEATATDIFGATVSHDAPDTFPLGTTAVSWTAVDGNGNQASATQDVHVIYRFDGFGGPIQPGGVYKANRNLPLMLGLSFADGLAATAATARLAVTPLGADGSSAEAVDVEAEGLADGGDLFRYTGDHYHFNLKTQGWSAGRYRLAVSLDDGRAYAMEIALR